MLDLRWCLLSFLALVLAPKAWAFPELVRHGYVNCTSCHVSPSGGGVLTAYGRQLSKEILGTAGTDQETRFIDLISTPEHINLGGDVRVLQLYRNTAQFSSGNLFLMQADLEASIKSADFTLDATLGYVNEAASSAGLMNSFISRRHYLIYEPKEEFYVRGGKFLYSYGINTADHSIMTKRGLRIDDEGTETYNLELSWLGEKTHFSLTGIFGRPDNLDLRRETGAALTSGVLLGTSSKAGLSYLYATTSAGSRHVVGPYGILGFTPKFFLLTEFDFQGASQVSNPTQERSWGFANYQRLDYEYFQGFHGFLTQQILRTDFANLNTLNRSFGLGIQFFPRPHFDLDLEWQILLSPTLPGYSDLGFLMMHVYL